MGLALLILICLSAVGCNRANRIDSPSVADAVAQRYKEPRRKDTAPPNANGQEAPAARRRSVSTGLSLANSEANRKDKSGTLATVNGRAISRDRVFQMLLAGHGVNVLERLVVLEQAKRVSSELGLNVTDVDVQTEYDRRLKRMLSPLEAADQNAEFDREEAERLLHSVLQGRNISMEEYLASIKRDAYLRAIAFDRMRFSDEDLQREYDAHFKERAQVRHIQRPTLAEARQVALMLQDGLDFAQAAKQHSANLRTGPSGGSLRPFGRTDARVPKALREAAFALEPGQVSDPVRVDGWHHLVKLEKTLIDPSADWSEHRAQLQHRLQEQHVNARLKRLYRTLLDEADIRINDPKLAKQYASRRSQRGQ
ncbi:MAG: hypothetical protein GXP29_13670 [Planctomycetes bacterium]|nr:hypothetical protein [Planctomycetota bacterium]